MPKSERLLQSDLFSLHDCPKCNNRSLLQANTKFRCLACEYYRDLEKPQSTKSSSDLPDAIFIAIILVVLGLIVSS